MGDKMNHLLIYHRLQYIFLMGLNNLYVYNILEQGHLLLNIVLCCREEMLLIDTNNI